MPILFLLVLVNFSFSAMVGTRVAFSLHALDLGASPFAVGMLAAANQVVPFALSYAVGVMSDRFPARWLLGAAACCGALGIALPAFVPGLAALYVASALCGAWGAFTSVVSQTLVGVMSTPETMTRNFSNQYLATGLTGIFGPLAAGWGVDHLGVTRGALALLPFALAVIAMLAVAGGVLPNARRGAAAPKERPPLRQLLREPGLLRVMAVSGVVQLGMDLYPFYMPVYGHALGLAASSIGVVMACGYVTSFSVRSVLPRLVKRLGEERTLAASLAITALSFALFTAAGGALTLGGVALLYGLGIGACAPLVTMFMFKRSPKGREGQAMGLRMMGNSAIRTCGPAVFGALAALVGLAGVFLATASVLGAAAWTLWRRAEAPPAV